MNTLKKNTHRPIAANLRATLAIGAGLLASFCASPAHAIAEGDIVLGDITVIRLHTDSGGVSAVQRASMVQERINEILAVPNLKAKDVVIVPTKYGPTIYVHKIKLITVDAATAKDENTTPDVLAKSWAHRLMGVIDQVDIRVPAGPTTPASPTTPDATPVTPGTPPATPTNPATPAGPTTPAPATPAPATPTAPQTPAPAAPTPPVKPDPAPATPPTPAPAPPAPAPVPDPAPAPAPAPTTPAPSTP